VLVSGAAGNFVSPALNMSPNGFKTVIDIDLLGTFNVLRQAHQYLRRPGASVISISAPQSFNPTIYQAHVCAAKAGVDMLTRVLAIEWGADGIRVNSIVPGPIGDTEGVRRLAPTEDARNEMAASIPLGRMGTRQEVADMAMVLSSSLASYVTGAVIPVDGGSSLLGGRDYRETYKASVAAQK
jgi:NAD(P)-dependent dehydrogenase (short-subunit alcohol dehydrogenase family)